MMTDSIYQFNQDDVFRFVSSVGARTRRKGNELEFVLCPYCMGGQHHDKNTFSINLETGQFKCLRSSCGAQGNMITLAKHFADRFELNRDVSAYYSIYNRNNQFKRFKNAQRQIESKDAAVRYLESRGISANITKLYEVTVRNDRENVLVFPFKDDAGILQFVKYRNLDYQPGKGSKEWCEENCKPILFGMNHCEDFGTLVITEGQIDSLSCSEAGIKNAVSVPMGKNGFTWKPHVWNWLMKFDEVVVFGDNENGNITLAKDISNFFPKRVRIVKPESYQGCKDANELLQKKGAAALVQAVSEAEVTVPTTIKYLSEVRRKDLSEMEHISSGFYQLDDATGGGLFFGSLVILTGKCGEGKSTLASMMIAYALRQNYKVFCYSGELPDYMFKAWLDSQVLGKITNREADINRINAWYGKRIFIYDNAAIGEYDAIKAAEIAIKNLDCRVILIDNLMTALNESADMDLYRQQSRFVRECADMAKKYNVLILLVTHPRKGNGTSNDDISGSGDIANYASLVMRYQRADLSDRNRSRLMITKNRMTGQILLDDSGIDMEYFPESRRVLEAGQVQPVFIGIKEPLPEGFIDLPNEETDIPFD